MSSQSHTQESERLQHMINGLKILIYSLVVLLGIAILCIASLMMLIR